MLADLVVVDQNPFEVPITDVHKTRVLTTLINGEIVYEAAPTKNRGREAAPTVHRGRVAASKGFSSCG
jgi:hypothetical protein